jgi:DNA-binding beta-propeller fold protein YncE
MAGLLPLTWFPQTALAKAPTAKLTVSGGRLTRSIEVTDPQILEISNAWGDAFLTASRPPLDEAPPGRMPYEVSFYSLMADHDLRKTCVVYYYPGTSTDPGLVYLPGKGAVWGLNVGTVLRRGQDGRWNYASPAWDGLIKAVITRAEAGAVQPRQPDDAAAKSAAFAKAPQVAIEIWSKPKTGWLYILDPQSEANRPGSRVWLMDPATGMVMGSIRAGRQADMVLSPNGARLYVVSGERETGELAVIETSSGTVHHVPFPDRVLYTPWYTTLPPFSRVTVSTDGRALRILGPRTFPPERAESQVFTFDTVRERFLPTAVRVGTCGGLASFVAASTETQFEILCDWDNTLHSIQVDTAYRETSNRVVKLPGAQDCPAAAGFVLPDNTSLALIRHDGTIDEMDRATQRFRPTGVTGVCTPPWVVFSLDWPRSPDGAKVYIGYGPSTPDNLATSNQFRVFDSGGWKQIGAFPTSVPFWSATASEDGTRIYALVPAEHRILVLDATTLKEKRTLRVGRMPAIAIVSP